MFGGSDRSPSSWSWRVAPWPLPAAQQSPAVPPSLTNHDDALGLGIRHKPLQAVHKVGACGAGGCRAGVPGLQISADQLGGTGAGAEGQHLQSQRQRCPLVCRPVPPRHTPLKGSPPMPTTVLCPSPSLVVWNTAS
jgi:hypothetical protein